MIAVDLLREHLRLDHDHDDDLLEELEQAAVAWLEQRVGYLGAPEEVTEIVVGTAGRDLYLTDAPATGQPVTVAGDGGAVADFTIAGYRLRRAIPWRGEFTVTYTRGFSPGREPAALQQAVKVLVATWYEQRVALTSDRYGATEVPLALDALIAPWVRPVIA